jgi:hypothetical protein
MNEMLEFLVYKRPLFLYGSLPAFSEPEVALLLRRIYKTMRYVKVTALLQRLASQTQPRNALPQIICGAIRVKVIWKKWHSRGRFQQTALL